MTRATVASADGPAADVARAVVLEPDRLMRLLVAPAVEALGFGVVGGGSCAARTDADGGGAQEGCGDAPGECAGVQIAGADPCTMARTPAGVFVPVERVSDCRRVCAEARRTHAAGPAPLVVGYGAAPPEVLAAHRAHRCADVVVRLVATAGRARFAHLPATDAVTVAGLSEREADVLILLLRGLTTPDIATALCVSSSTARTHCRAVLRKLGAGDRRALRTRLLSGPSDLGDRPSGGPAAGPAVLAGASGQG